MGRKRIKENERKVIMKKPRKDRKGEEGKERMGGR